MTYRRYIFVLLGGVGLTAAFLMVAAIRLQPYFGDLTRQGGFSENQFGWAGDQTQYLPPLAQSFDAAKTYDMMVIGDSFSSRTVASVQTQPGGFWTDRLSALSGLSIGVAWETALSVDRYLKSPGFHDHPPRLLVVERVERKLPTFTNGGPQGCPTPPLRSHDRLEKRPVAAPSIIVQRPRWHLSAVDAVDEANDFIVKFVKRGTGFGNRDQARRLSLTRSDLFSNPSSQEILVLTEDFDKQSWTTADLDRISCVMRSWQTIAETNGYTRLLFLIVPDKTTVYDPYLRDRINMPDFIAPLSERVGAAVLRLDRVLADAVKHGTRDVYLPNDTHWGSAGTRLAAEFVADEIFVPTPPKSAHPPPAAKPPPP